jgi:hypothetical protein
MPGKSVDTYLFALYDEDLKPGPGSERSFGLFKTDLTMVYDFGFSTSSQVRTKSMSLLSLLVMIKKKMYKEIFNFLIYIIINNI